MLNDKRLIYLATVDGIDFYRYRSSLFRYFYTPMAYYEKLFTRCIRETLDYLRGGHNVVYMARGDKLVGYGVVTRGGGRNRFCTGRDIVLGSLWVQPEARGQGLGNTLIRGLTDHCGFVYENAYEYIRHDNLPSVKAAEHNGFVKVANATHRGLLRSVFVAEDGHLGIYRRPYVRADMEKERE